MSCRESSLHGLGLPFVHTACGIEHLLGHLLSVGKNAYFGAEQKLLARQSQREDVAAGTRHVDKILGPVVDIKTSHLYLLAALGVGVHLQGGTCRVHPVLGSNHRPRRVKISSVVGRHVDIYLPQLRERAPCRLMCEQVLIHQQAIVRRSLGTLGLEPRIAVHHGVEFQILNLQHHGIELGDRVDRTLPRAELGEPHFLAEGAGKVVDKIHHRRVTIHIAVQSHIVHARFLAVELLVGLDKLRQPLFGLIGDAIVDGAIGKVERRSHKLQVVVASNSLKGWPALCCLLGGHVGLGLEVGLVEAQQIPGAWILSERVAQRLLAEAAVPAHGHKLHNAAWPQLRGHISSRVGAPVVGPRHAWSQSLDLGRMIEAVLSHSALGTFLHLSPRSRSNSKQG